MIKPRRLNKGDTIALVSLSSGMAGDKEYLHKFLLGKARLENDFGLKAIVMPNALKGSEYLDKHPEARTSDLMEAFKNKEIKGIISIIGGDDTVRLLPYIDYEVIKNNPKIFMGYSDTTVNHFMMYKAGLISYYGPAVLSEFGENNKMHDYTVKYINEVLFEGKNNISIESSSEWTSEFLDWSNEENDNILRNMNVEEHGFEVLQGKGEFNGELLGGCIDVFQMITGTDVWPKKDEWKNKILFLETGEDEPEPDTVKYLLRNLVAQGIIDEISGIIVGKPSNEKYYEEYKEVFKRVIALEALKKDLPILYNVNFGHTAPMCILPIGCKVLVNLDSKKIIITESPDK